jgi:myo-inositol-1(or 4)-monophosphatase
MTTAIETATDSALLPLVVDAARRAGERLLERYSPDARVTGIAEMAAVGDDLEDGSEAMLRDLLGAVRPHAQWVTDEIEAAGLPDGEWWCVDGIEGGVNHVHGLPAWGVTATLLRDLEPVLTVVHMPLADETYTAVRGGGAAVNGRPLRVSAKTDLGLAVAIGGQVGRGGDGPDGRRRIGESVMALLERVLLVRLDVPTTFPLLHVATGRMDVFWQHGSQLQGVAAGSLLVAEAGGVVTDLTGQPWRPGDTGMLAAAPGVHAAALAALSTVA